MSADPPSPPRTLRALGRRRGRAPHGRDLVLATLQRHAPELLRLARRYSLAADDAHDAYQRGVEIFLRRADTLDPDTAIRWLRTVVKHEALAVRAERLRLVGPEETDLDQRPAAHLPTPEERIESFDLLARSAESLQRLKPAEVKALLLKAEGHSYEEIGALMGWSYTKVNRLLTEGRRALLDRAADIASGRECERWAPALSAMADGEATGKQLVDLRPHLRHCPGCRATVRRHREGPARVAALIPVAVAVAGNTDDATSQGAGLVVRLYEAIVGGVHDRATLVAGQLQSALDAVAGGKTVAVLASGAALAGGGVAAVDPGAENPARHASAGTEHAAGRRNGDAAPATGPSTPAPSSAPSGPEHEPEPDRSPEPRREAGTSSSSSSSSSSTSGTRAPVTAPQDQPFFDAGASAATPAAPASKPQTSPPVRRAARAGGGGEFGP